MGLDARKYNDLKLRIFCFELLFTPFLLWVLNAAGLSDAAARSARAAFAARSLQDAFYAAILFHFLYAAGLPLRFFSGYVVEKQAALSRHTPAAWALDEIKAYALSLSFFTLTAAAFLAIVRHFPTTWWLVAAAGWFILTVILAKLLPQLLIPMFYRMKPLADTALRGQLLELARRCKVKVSEVYEIDFSKKTGKANAAVVGLGRGRRIILADTLLERFSPAETQMVTAHELGHCAERHIAWGILFNAAAVLGGFWILRGVSVAAGGSAPLDSLEFFPTLLFLSWVGGLVLLPIQNGFSRMLERRADRYALNILPDKTTFMSVMNKLGQQNLADPAPDAWVEFFLYSHPSIPKRIKAADAISV